MKMEGAGGSLSQSILRLVGARISGLNRSMPISILRWPSFDLSWLAPSWTDTVSRWPGIGFSFIDSLLWAFVVAFETLALLVAICLFFVFCGCSI